MTLLVIVLIIVTGILVFLYYRKHKDYEVIVERFKDVVDIEREADKSRKLHESNMKRYGNEIEAVNRLTEKLKREYAGKRDVYDKLKSEIKLMDDTTEMMSYGVYTPHFDFDSSERYKQQLQGIRQEQKQMIREKKAAVCSIEWTIDGSKAKGRTATNRNIKLILRAFNNECDAAVLRVKWNNIQTMEQRINKAFESINKLGEPHKIYISSMYLHLKLKELYCAYEYQDKLHEEKEEQRRIREQMREEEKVQREIEKAKQEAERDEVRYQEALEKARDEVGQAEGAKLEKLKAKLAELEKKLEEARQNKERAVSRAQLTKSGHVYIISNIGSFGEGVYKIGMSRRLEPADRVKELGDASVPFAYDIHGMIYSDNAPELENSLHKHFDRKRVNLVNARKEFFRVPLEEIQEVVRSSNLEVEFTKLAEAREFRETLAILEQQMGKVDKQAEEDKFPDTL